MNPTQIMFFLFLKLTYITYMKVTFLYKFEIYNPKPKTEYSELYLRILLCYNTNN